MTSARRQNCSGTLGALNGYPWSFCPGEAFLESDSLMILSAISARIESLSRSISSCVSQARISPAYAACSGRLSVSSRRFCSSVTITQPLSGRDPDEVVELREVVAGQVSANDVTANGALAETVRGVGIFGEAMPLATQFWGKVEPGCIGQPGEWSATYDPGTGEYTLADSWGDIWQEGDTFTFAYSQVKGDFALTAHIAKRNPHPFCRWGRNGLMIRQDLTNASRLNLIFDNLWGEEAIAAQGEHEDKLAWGYRQTHGDVDSIANEETQLDGDWLQIERSGDTMIGYYSQEGVN